MKTAAPVPLAFQNAGRKVLLLGGIGDCDLTRFGGTQYAKAVLKNLWGLPPALDMAYEKRVQSAIREIVNAGLAESAHDLSDGGLAVALAESSFGQKKIGAAINLDSDLRPEFLLFHEAPSRVVLSTGSADQVRQIAAKHDVAVIEIGDTVANTLEIRNRNEALVNVPVSRLHDSWDGALEHALAG
jgi:phosphoribosylformylglycinamidine synthase